METNAHYAPKFNVMGIGSLNGAAGTVITPAGTAIVHGQTLKMCQVLGANDATVAGMEFGAVEFKVAGPKVIVTISHSLMQK